MKRYTISKRTRRYLLKACRYLYPYRLRLFVGDMNPVSNSCLIEIVDKKGQWKSSSEFPLCLENRMNICIALDFINHLLHKAPDNDIQYNTSIYNAK